MEELVYKKANIIQKVLNEYFLPLYIKEQVPLYPQLQASQPITRSEPININFPVIPYIPPAPIIINNPQPIIIQSQPIIVHKKDEEEEKKKEEDANDMAKKIVGGVALAGISFAGTYLVATDGYVNFLLSDVETAIQGLMELKDTSVKKHEILVFKYDYDVWKSFYLKRTKKTFLGKVGGVGSGLFMAGALMASSGFGIVVGAVAAVGSGCYLLWNKLTAKTMTEEEAYDAMMKSLMVLSGPQIQTIPSAPPMDPVQMIGPGMYQLDYSAMNTEVYRQMYQPTNLFQGYS